MAIPRTMPAPMRRQAAKPAQAPSGPSPKMPARTAPVPYGNLPVWRHPEHGRWKPCAGPPVGDTERLYYGQLLPLLERKWRETMPGEPMPAAAFARMRPADGTDPWCSVDMFVLEKKTLADWAPFLAAVRDDNLLSFQDSGRYAYVSPFFEWGLADYWENGYYDR